MKNNIKKALKKVALGGVLVAAASGVHAASQGTIGANSTGSTDISLQVLGAIKISNIADITLPDFSGAAVSGNTGVCVYTNATGGLYEVTASATGGFALDEVGPGTNTIAFTVDYNDGSNTFALTNGTAQDVDGASATDDDCGGSGTNATVTVNVSSAAASAVPQGDYAKTLTLVVAPR